MCGSSPSDRDPTLRRHYSPPDPGGRGNGKDEPNRPWWTKPLAAVIVAFGLTVPAGCATAPDDDDLPGQVDTSLDDRCADLDNPPADCEE